MFMQRGDVSPLWLPCREGKCKKCIAPAGTQALPSPADAPATMGGAQRTKGCRLVMPATATLLVVLGCVLILLLLYEGFRHNHVFYSLLLPQLKRHRLHEQQQQQEQLIWHQRRRYSEGNTSAGRVAAARQTGLNTAGVRNAAVESNKSRAITRSSSAYWPPGFTKRRYAFNAAASALSLHPTGYAKSRIGVNNRMSPILMGSLSSNLVPAHPLRLSSWHLCGSPLVRAPTLADAIASSQSSSLSFRPASSSLRLQSLSSSVVDSPSFPFTATNSAAIEEPTASHVGAGAAADKHSPSHFMPLHDRNSAPTIAATASRLSAPTSPPYVSAALAASPSVAPAVHRAVSSTMFLKKRGPPKTPHSQHGVNIARKQQPHQYRDDQHNGQHQDEPQEPRDYYSLPAREERMSLVAADPVSASASSPRTSRFSSGALYRRLEVLDTFINMGTQFIMYPEMATMLEEHLGTLKRAFSGDSTADLKIPVYISAADDCLVALDFVADQDNGDNYHLGRVLSSEIEISISFAQHQGLLKYKERRSDFMQVAKFPVLHLQRFDLPKNCLSTANGVWTAYCTAPAPKTCYVGRVDLHLSSLGSEDQLTYVAPVPFSAYVESQLQDGITYSEVLDQVEAPTPLLRLLFDDFRCLLHFRFHTVETNSILFFWLRNRQGIRIDVKDASTNTVVAKKTTIPRLCGAEQPEDIQATWTELPDGSYKALVQFRQYFEYDEVYSGFVKIERKEPDKRPERVFEYYNDEQLEFDKFFPKKDHIIPLTELPRIVLKQ